MVNNPAKLGYWKLVFQGSLVYPPAQQTDSWGNYNGVPTFSKGYIWGAPAAVVQSDINNDIVNPGWSDNPQVRDHNPFRLLQPAPSHIYFSPVPFTQLKVCTHPNH